MIPKGGTTTSRLRTMIVFIAQINCLVDIPMSCMHLKVLSNGHVRVLRS